MLLRKEKGASLSVENIESCLIYQEGVAHHSSIYADEIVLVIVALSVMTCPSTA